MSTKKEKSIIPIYSVCAAVVLYSLLFPLLSLLDFAILAAVGCLAYFVASKVFPGKYVEAPASTFAKTNDKEANAALAVGKAFIENLYTFKNSITNQNVKMHVVEIIKDCEKIYSYISRAPESYRLIRTFTEYYVPQTEKILSTFIELANLESTGKSITETLLKIEAAMPDIANGFSNQLDNLYNDKAFDIRTDLRVFEGLIKEDGLRG